jgi:hypothetical protein
MYAEHIKSKGDKIPEETRMMLEVYIPSLSIICLICVTFYVTNEAVAIIIKPPNESGEEVDIAFLYGFAAFNFVVDLISGYVFLRGGKRAFITINKEISGNCEFSSDSTDEIVNPQTNDANLNMMAGN